MKKVDELKNILKSIQEDDDVAMAGSDEMPPENGALAGNETPPKGEATPEPIYDQDFYRQLKAGDEFSDKELPDVKYKVVEEPVINADTGEVTSLVVEVTAAPEDNPKELVIGDQFDMIMDVPRPNTTETPIPGEPTGSADETPPGDEIPPDETPPGDEMPPEDEIPPSESKISEKGKKRIPAVNKAQSMGKGITKKESLAAAFLNKTKELKEAQLTRGIIQEIRKDGTAVIRVGKWRLELPGSGYKVGEEVDIEDNKKIIGVVKKRW